MPNNCKLITWSSRPSLSWDAIIGGWGNLEHFLLEHVSTTTVVEKCCLAWTLQTS